MNAKQRYEGFMKYLIILILMFSINGFSKFGGSSSSSSRSSFSSSSSSKSSFGGSRSSSSSSSSSSFGGSRSNPTSSPSGSSSFGGSRASGQPATITRPSKPESKPSPQQPSLPPSQPTVVHQTTIINHDSGGSFYQNWAMYHMLFGQRQPVVVYNNQGIPMEGQTYPVVYEQHSVFYYIGWCVFWAMLVWVFIFIVRSFL
jgi:hypothetical protein